MIYPESVVTPAQAKRFRQKSKFVELNGGVCFYCSAEIKPENLTRDHILPKSWGLPLYGNQVCACANCNWKKGDKPPCRDLIAKFIHMWALHPYKTNAIGELYHDFHLAEALISKIAFWVGEPNIPGMVRCA